VIEYGYEFDCRYRKGPFDGLKSIVISLNESVPPTVVFEPHRKEIREEKVELGRKLLQKWAEKHVPDDTRVAAYEIYGDPADYDDEEDVVPYDYVGSMSFSEYKEKYWS
jgi:hypothetical protein